ncbi:MAG: 3-dehydroquinate synthase [Actinomycetota bacterium]|nr:3-dehydroquinate synthase [Actinomycetota bacterium]
MTATDSRTTEGRLDAIPTGTGFTATVRRITTYRILIGQALTDELVSLLTPLVAHLGSPSILIAADANIRRIVPRLVEQVGAIGVPTTVTWLPTGEITKSLTGLQTLWNALGQASASRRSLLIGLGGGVICDLTTLAAATYMRGLPYVLIPTTVLAQVDAAIGGKGGIDYDDSKNLLGAFHHPTEVIIDTDLTSTLSARHIRSGLAEVIKIALIADPDLFTVLENHTDHLPDGPALTQIVRTAVATKLTLLADDPFEHGDLRRPLNLGHCFGHPIEAASGYRMPHGEAVAAGIAITTAIAHTHGLATTADRTRIINLLAAYRLPTSIPPTLRETVWQGLETIRRIRNGSLQLVVPYRPGVCGVIADIDDTEFDSALTDLDRLTRTRR